MIFYVPSHRGILGNEVADKAAKGHELPIITIPNTTIKEGKTFIEARIKSQWERNWQLEMVQHRGIHLSRIKTKVGKWEWASSYTRE